jgi:hypothetical protein
VTEQPPDPTVQAPDFSPMDRVAHRPDFPREGNTEQEES